MVQHATHGITSCMSTCQCGNTLQNPECTSQSTKAWNSRVLYWNIMDASVATLTNFNFHQQQWLSTIKQLLHTELELKMAFHSKQLHSFSWFLVFICFSAVSVRKSANNARKVLNNAFLCFFFNQHLMPNLMPALCVTPYPLFESCKREKDRSKLNHLLNKFNRQAGPASVRCSDVQHRCAKIQLVWERQSTGLKKFEKDDRVWLRSRVVGGRLVFV